MSVLRRLGRLFVIRTRWEAWAVTWAIALGAVERGKVYLQTYPGLLGWVFFTLCCGVVFLAGAKLLDSVRPQPRPVRRATVRWHPRRPAAISRAHPRGHRPTFQAARPNRRKD